MFMFAFTVQPINNNDFCFALINRSAATCFEALRSDGQSAASTMKVINLLTIAATNDFRRESVNSLLRTLTDANVHKLLAGTV